jgi:hypothetical protein
MPLTNKSSRSEYNRRYYLENSGKNRQRRKVGPTPNQDLSGKHRVDVNALLDKQHGKCALCSAELNGSFHVDHDHGCCPGVRSCGACVRGILCQSCNFMEGWLSKAMRLGLVTAASGPLAEYMSRRVRP